MKGEKKMEENKNELQKESKKTHIANLEREIKIAEEQKANIQKNIDLMKQDIEFSAERLEAMLKAYKLKEPKWNFEETEEYLEPMKKLERVAHGRQVLDKYAQIKQMEANINSINEQINLQLKPELERVTKQLE